jgi:DtxR family Mn-dependent transcriptional regulator
VQQHYVEVIADFERRNGSARTCDIAEEMDISLPSVSEAVRRLVCTGLVSRRSRHEIVLSAKGQGLADQLEGRQKALHHFMTDILGFEDGDAERLACELEHSVDAKFVKSLLVLDEFMDSEGNGKVKQAWTEFRKMKFRKGVGERD